MAPLRIAVLGSALSLLGLAPTPGLAEPAILIRAADLKRDPASDAPTLAQLPEKAKVDALERKGGWTRVKTEAGAEGWIKMLVLRYFGPVQASQGDSGAARALDTARGSVSGAAPTTGVRGLDPDMLASAQPNPAELKKMEGFAVTKEAAAGFAASASLQARSIAYPKEVK